MGETKKSFNVKYKEIENLFFNEVSELIEKSGNEQKALRNLENNMESFKKNIIAKYEDSESKNNNSNIQNNQANQSCTSIDSSIELPTLHF